MRECMHVLDRSIRHQQTVLPLKIVAPVSCLLDHLLVQREVFGMHTRADHVERDFRSRLQFVNAIELLRPRDLVSSDVPGKTARATEMLCLGQKRRAAQQLLFDTFSVGDIRSKTYHPQWLAGVVKEHATLRGKPMKTSIRPDDAILGRYFS